MGKADLYCTLQKADSANFYLTKCLKNLEARKSDFSKANGLNLKACLTGKLGRLDAALQYLDSSRVAQEPGSNYFSVQGFILLEKHNYEEALSSLTRSIEMQPDNPEAYLYRGLTYHRLNKAEAGCNDLKMSAKQSSYQANMSLRALCK